MVPVARSFFLSAGRACFCVVIVSGAREHGYCESFNWQLRQECLNGKIFYALTEARILIERWRRQYNTMRAHSALASGLRPRPVELRVRFDET